MNALPDSIPPRGLNDEQAAEYVGVSVNTLQRHGPKPTKIAARNVYDRKVLDLWLDQLSGIEAASDPKEALMIAINARKNPVRHNT